MAYGPFRTLARALPAAILATFGAVSAVGPALADKIPVTTKIDAVTLFRTGAEITRTFSIALEPGEHELQIELPQAIQRNSINIEETSSGDVVIRALELEVAPTDADAKAASIRALNDRIASIEADMDRYRKVIENAGFSRELIETLALRKIQPAGPSTSPDLPRPEDLSALLDTVESRLAQNTDSVLDAEAKIRAAREQIETLKREIAALGESAERNYVGTFHVVVPAKLSAQFELSYRLSSASWQPFYHAHLDTGSKDRKPRIEFMRNAVIAQSTSEDWTDVALTLSTAQATNAVSTPALSKLSVSAFRRESAVSGNANAPATEGASDLVRQMQQNATVVGFNAVFSIPERISLQNDGAPKYVQIGASEHDAELHLEAVPKLDLKAFLVARFAPQDATPLLPGYAMLFRDGVFLGEDPIPLTAPGDQIELDFGADDLVSIEREELQRTSGETGLVSSTFVDERSYLTRITNSHDVPLDITVKDQVPVSDDERIRVELMPGTKRPDDDDWTENGGFLSWTQTLKPHTVEEIPFSFRVVWPKSISR